MPRQSPAIVLLFTAMIWAAIWWPYRVLEQQGLSPALSSAMIYAAGLAIALIASRGRISNPLRDPRLLLLAVASAACNFGYTVSAIYAPVMKVLLLFYTAPLWTVLLARVMLHERIGLRGTVVLALCVAGELLMLWRPELGYPWPASGWEWIALAAGFFFALYNVLIRALPQGEEMPRMALIFATSMAAALLWGMADNSLHLPAAASAGLAAITGVVLWTIFVTMQWGLQRLAANHAALLMTTELIFAALFSWWWAGETMDLRETLGAVLVGIAALTAAWQSSHGVTLER